jgi:hypothetical protein
MRTGHQASQRDHEALVFGVGTFEFGDFTPLIQYARLLKRMGSM